MPPGRKNKQHNCAVVSVVAVVIVAVVIVVVVVVVVVTVAIVVVPVVVVGPVMMEAKELGCPARYTYLPNEERIRSTVWKTTAPAMPISRHQPYWAAQPGIHICHGASR